MLAVPTGVPEWRVLNDPAAFDAAVALIPALRLWADPAGVDPITGVLAMANGKVVDIVTRIDLVQYWNQMRQKTDDRA